jgi:hypothetical protein
VCTCKAEKKASRVINWLGERGRKKGEEAREARVLYSVIRTEHGCGDCRKMLMGVKIAEYSFLLVENNWLVGCQVLFSADMRGVRGE